MDCPDDSTFVAYTEGALDVAATTAFEAHLDACEACREALAALARVATPAGAEEDPEPAGPRLRARGSTCGRYLVLDVRGAGGMGVVYTAYDPELDRRVALKLVRPQVGAANLRERLAREARVLARISHPNVVPIYDVGESDGEVFIAMEFVPGPTLARWQTEATRPWRAILDMYLQAARGLAHAHAAGVVHRDFKPGNALVGPDGRVRVVDFGLAVAPSEASAGEPASLASASLTATGALVGTPAYMAPEQWRGAPVDARSDQYSFCAALWEALAGAPYRLPETTWRGPPAPEPAPATTGGRAFPRWLRQLLLRGLADDPQARLPGMQALIDACERRLHRGRRGTLLAAGGLVVAAALVVLLGGGNSPPPQLCRDDPSWLTGVWDREAARALRQGFAASGLPFAATVAGTAVSALDAWAERWHRERRAACEATRVYGHQTEVELARRTACLDERRAALRERVRLLQTGERDVVEAAVAIAHELPEPATCRDPAALLRDGEGDDDEARRGRAEVDRAAALVQAGRFAAAETDAEAAGAAARVRGWQALAAAAQRVVGEARQGRGAGAEAEEAYYQSLWASEAARDDRAATRAWTRLAALLADELARPDEARRAVAHARAAYARAGDDPLLGAELELAAALGERSSGDWQAANTRLRAVVAALTRHAPPADPRLLTALRQYGRSFFDLGEHEASAAEYRRALALAEQHLGADHPVVADLANNLGTTLLDQRDVAGAEAELRRALAIDLRVYGPLHLSTAAAFGNLANFEATRGDLARAEQAYRTTLQIYAKQPKRHPDAAKVAYNLSSVLINTARPAEAKEQLEWALALQRETLGEDHPDTGAYLTGIGISLTEMGRPAEAIAPLEAAIALFERRPRDARYLGAARNELARALWDSGGDKLRARGLAESAAAIFRAQPEAERLLREVETWLAAHPLPRG
ncbi:tetratricopeptide repeat protein [Nannocystis sp. SCPEA4]|uniref:protein kinase domain-containing protein n=1 Tax=Nannocystis sp. SCPEA4 TaxID=2996787 RepID=UPI0022700AB5|nr:tetratricopeptide repeat protein [Nannocystis sp. SCPEA4]